MAIQVSNSNQKFYTLDTPFKIVSVKLHAVLWCNNGNVNVYAHRFPEKIRMGK